ncbi:SLAC1 anion channel family protein [Pedobacter sp. Leaf194]|uniref:SLAC1 anion channel family protein n=1 Tax=Pedobacter sp. Leaf194 TaxID=1736297 RepID=UPI0009E6BD4C|nr:SLAC1 anion channel family protein [Pedobacter sp. Leaf194]
MQTLSREKSFLEFLPVSLFGGIMGLCGLTFSWRLAEKAWHINTFCSEVIGMLALSCFIALSIAYILKIMKYPSLVFSELKHPVQACFFATMIVSLLLIPGVLFLYLPVISKILWLVGAILIFFFAIFILRKWLDNQQTLQSAVPVWILPVVGTLDVPIVGLHLGIPEAKEICTMFFGIGLIFSIILMVIVLSRLLFQAQLSKDIQPTLLILTAPFALAYTCYIQIQGKGDLASATMFYFNLFLFLILSGKILLLPKTCPFKVSWWSVSFPLTAVTVTCFNYASTSVFFLHRLISIILLAITTLIIIYLFIQTVYRIITGTFIANPSKN